MGHTLVYYGDLIGTLVAREIRLRYRRSVLGVLWSLINPLLSLLIFVFLFQSVLRFNVPYYPVYVFSGLLAWNWFSASLSAATYTLFQGRDLVRKPSFPIEALVLVMVSSNLVNYLLALPILLGLMFISSVPADLSLLALPLLIAIQFLFTAGLSFFIAVLNVYYRDVEHLVTVGIGLWFYLTPIFYKSNAVAHTYDLIFALNPMAHLVRDYRAVFLTHEPLGMSSLAWLALVAVAWFALGLLFFRRHTVDIVDEI